MKLRLHEITDQDTDLDFTQEELWVLQAVARLDEYDHETGKTEAPATPRSRPVKVHFNLRKVDEVVVVSGNIDTSVELICSRCANIFPFACKTVFSALYCSDPDTAGVAHLEGAGKPVGQNQGYARHAHDFDEIDENSTGKDLDITYLAEDSLDLAAVLTEQIHFQIPFQPLCREDCKGICVTCGTDLNLGRCACAKIPRSKPFSALGNIKIP